MTIREPEDNFDGQKENIEDDSSENVQTSTSPDTLRILEAVLFASDELLTSSQLKAILPGSPDAKKIRSMVEQINIQLQKERHPFEIVEIGGGYQFRTISYYYPWVKQIFKEKADKKLSMQALECLAIIAYKQPISKAEIEAIRGVISDGALKTLLEKRLIGVYGRSDKPGHPLLYGTTQNFLKYFGLNKLEDLPRIEEFEAIAKEKMEGLSDEELSQPLKEEELEEVDIEEVATLQSVEKSENREDISSTEDKGEKVEENKINNQQENTEEIKKEENISDKEEAIIESESEVEIDSLIKENSEISSEKDEKSEIKEETIFDLEEASSEKKELSSTGDKEESNYEKEEAFDLESEIESAEKITEEDKNTNKEEVENISQEEEKKNDNSQEVQVLTPTKIEDEALDLEEIVVKKEDKKEVKVEEEIVDLEQIREKVPEEVEDKEDSKKNNVKNSKKRNKKKTEKNSELDS